MQKSSTTLHLEKACVLQGIPQQPKLKLKNPQQIFSNRLKESHTMIKNMFDAL